jgi:hypothetical protein
MSGLSTKDVKTGGGGLPKTIAPGAHTLKINGIELKQFPFMVADEAYYLMISVETKPIDGFDGFFIDKDNESLGRYAGQIGQIKTNRFYYKDGETKSGIPVSRDMEVLKQLKNLCIASNAMEWFDAVDGKYDTIEEFVDAFNAEKPYEGKLYNFCVAGKEYERNNGYTGFDLFLPKLSRGTVAFQAETAKVNKVIPYNEDEMLQKLAPKEIEDFDAATVDDLLDADTPPEFDL